MLSRTPLSVELRHILTSTLSHFNPLNCTIFFFIYLPAKLTFYCKTHLHPTLSYLPSVLTCTPFTCTFEYLSLFILLTCTLRYRTYLQYLPAVHLPVPFTASTLLTCITLST
ncbi:conserved hypothetical protein [Trichinella spiralis]|uniref:hypothetical protein n=1 Tax=Trichinella spiralis TaxID=6334 RepID=UPI0001EFBDA4|nr:conserved hypothetical protein [Trichinella spiralis]